MQKVPREIFEQRLKEFDEAYLQRRKDRKEAMKAKFSDRPQEDRIIDIVAQCAQHAPNHPDFEAGMIRDHIAKLDEIEAHRVANGFPAGKYDKNKADLQELLAELEALPPEPTFDFELEEPPV